MPDPDKREILNKVNDKFPWLFGISINCNKAIFL